MYAGTFKYHPNQQIAFRVTPTGTIYYGRVVGINNHQVCIVGREWLVKVDKHYPFAMNEQYPFDTIVVQETQIED